MTENVLSVDSSACRGARTARTHLVSSLRIPPGPRQGPGSRSKHRAGQEMVLVLCVLFFPSLRVWGEADAGAHDTQKKTITTLTPPSAFYSVYIADPVRPQSAVKLLYFPDSEIPDVGVGRVSVHLGGRFGLVRWHPEDGPERGLQLDFEGGFFAQFDLEGGLDNIGWDFDF